MILDKQAVRLVLHALMQQKEDQVYLFETARASSSRGHKNSTVQADDDEPTVNIQLLLGEKGLININVSGKNAEKLPEGVTIFGPVFFPEKVRVLGDSEAIDMSPVDSPEHAHVGETISKEEDEIVAQDEDEIVAQDEDEPEPSLDSELEDFDIKEAAIKLKKRVVRIDSSSITLPLCS
jgi:hypothetical protein